jgi:hypothetical protein
MNVMAVALATGSEEQEMHRHEKRQETKPTGKGQYPAPRCG